MKSHIIAFIKFVINKMRIDALVLEVQNERAYHYSRNRISCKKGVRLGEKFKVFNFQNDPSVIKIGESSFLEGELLVFEYGGKIIIGEKCYIGPNSIIRSSESIIIESNVLISHGVNIMDNNAHEVDSNERRESLNEYFNSGRFSNKGNIKSAPIIIEENAWISFNAIILKGVKIGKGAIVGAGAVVTKNVEPYTLVGGNPAKVLKRLTD